MSSTNLLKTLKLTIMKKTALFLVAFIGISFYMNAQCSKRFGTFVPNSPDTSTYPIEGTANITIADNGTISVNFEDDFNSVQGFILQVFLSKTQNIDTDTPNDMNFIRVDQTGDLLCDEHQSFDEDHNGHEMTKKSIKKFTQNLTGVDINDYNYVILQCTKFNVPWGYAQLGAETTINCNVLSVEDKEFASIDLLENPIKDVIKISNPNQQQVAIRVFDTAGNLVASKEETKQGNQLDVSTLATGFYVMELSSGGHRKTKQLVIL